MKKSTLRIASFFLPVCTLFANGLHAQEMDSVVAPTLDEVTVRAVGPARRLRDVPAAVGYVSRQTLLRFNTGSVVQAVNTIPGVRMEERSPGSYRLNIRGSSLRSPFGVRNVKVYFNGIPITDPGGGTYLNGLGYYNFGSVEVLKGPGSSLYGAGTGGALLIQSPQWPSTETVRLEHTVGSYGLQNSYASLSVGDTASRNRFDYQRLRSHGYRTHSESARDVFGWTGHHTLSDRQNLQTTLLYSRLFYETPGALTLAEYNANAKAARPAAGGFPSAEAAKASIRQQTFLGGVHYAVQAWKPVSFAATAYGMYTELRNPAVRNWGKNVDPHVGTRIVGTYNKESKAGRLTVYAGFELQQGFSTVSVYKNRNGNADTLQTEDEVPVRQRFGFAQAAFERAGWELTAGASLNSQRLEFRRAAPAPGNALRRNMANELSPRASLSKKWKGLTAYTGVSKGFSPPTLSELVPSGSNVNLELQPETGTNYDLGTRGNAGKFGFDVNAFVFGLQNTIVQRRDAGGGDTYVNAGRMAQRGIEVAANYRLANAYNATQALFWLGYTWQRFRYKEFIQGTADFSGNRLPGVAPHTLTGGVDLRLGRKWWSSVNYYYSDAVPLNDANSAYANAYHLLNAKAGYGFNVKQLGLQLSAGIENILDQTYSLGNDVNAAGGRYYNAAPRRNGYVSVALQR